MNSKNKLILSMWTFTIIIIVLFSILIINEKKYIILEDKVEKKLVTYITNNYSEIKEDVIIGKISYIPKDYSYQIKIENKINKNLYFIVTYKNKKIKSTYERDYVEGKSLLVYYQKKFESELKEGRRAKTNVSFSRKLNRYTQDVYEKLLHNEIKDLPIYTIKTELKPNQFLESDITNSILEYYKNIYELGYVPKSFEFTFLFDDINHSFTLSNMTSELINSNTKEIISSIINNDKSIMEKYNITYEYIY